MIVGDKAIHPVFGTGVIRAFYNETFGDLDLDETFVTDNQKVITEAIVAIQDLIRAE